jgi:hypothetical protein
MRNFLRIADNADITPLLLAVQRRPALWDVDTFWKHHPVPVFREADTIYLRFPDKRLYSGDAPAGTLDPWEAFNQPAFAALPEARPLVFGLMARMEAERLGRVLINRLPAGGYIPAHRDMPPGTNYYDRFHIVLSANGGCNFHAGGETVQMAAGEVWWFDYTQEHAIDNTGDTDRIHLIVDMRLHKESP